MLLVVPRDPTSCTKHPHNSSRDEAGFEGGRGYKAEAARQEDGSHYLRSCQRDSS